MKPHPQPIESLEPRIAPAAVFFYTDVDGDDVTIRTSKGTNLGLDAIVHPFLLAAGLGGQLQKIDFSLDPEHFAGTDLTVTVRRAPTGDGFANIGYIDAGLGDGGTKIDLGVITIQGDLGAIDAGDGVGATPAIKSLTVASMGRFGTATGAPKLHDIIDGRVGKLVVKTDVKDAFFDVSDSSGGGRGRIDAISIGGSLIGGADAQSGNISANDGIGGVKIGRDVAGGAGLFSGEIFSGAAIDSVIIGSNIVGGTNSDTGLINGTTGLGAVTVGGSIIGGTIPGGAPGNDSGEVFSNGDIGLVKIGRDVRGGGVSFSGVVRSSLGKVAGVTVGGSLVGGGGPDSGEISSGGDLGKVVVHGDVLGGSAANAGIIRSGDKLAGAAVGGSLIGGTKDNSAAILSVNEMGSIDIGHDVLGGAGTGSGTIATSGFLKAVKAVHIHGSLIGGSGLVSGSLRPIGNLGIVVIDGDVVAGTANGSGSVFPVGGVASLTIGGSLVGVQAADGDIRNAGSIVVLGDIGSLTIGGDVVGGKATGPAFILRSGSIDVSDGGIGKLSIGGSVLAGSAAAGGIVEFAGTIEVDEAIGSLVVKGSVIGNASQKAQIGAAGQISPTATTNVAIGSVSIGGRVENAQFLAGYNSVFNPVNGNAQIGAVKVGGDWIASDLVAGIDPKNGRFGDADDAIIGGGASIAKIASITIAGQVFGSAAAGDSFGFESHEIGSFKIGGGSIRLTPGANMDLVPLSRLTADVVIREI